MFDKPKKMFVFCRKKRTAPGQIPAYRSDACVPAHVRGSPADGLLFLFITAGAAGAAAPAAAATLFAGADRVDDGADERRGDEQQDDNVGGAHTSSLPTL